MNEVCNPKKDKGRKNLSVIYCGVGVGLMGVCKLCSCACVCFSSWSVVVFLMASQGIACQGLRK